MIRKTSNNTRSVGSQLYFYGRITRDEAEHILRNRGCQDGLFLLRESTKKMGDFVVSLCFNNNIHHYSLETQGDGQVMIENGKKFPGPVELLEYHKSHKDGLLTFPTLPCSRPPNESFTVFRGVSAGALEQKLEAKAKQLKIQFTRDDLLNPGEIRNRLLNEIKPTLHQEQKWFHDDVSREDAEKRLLRSGHENGKFLLRMQRGKGEYRLTLSYRGESKHYIVSYKNSKYYIENGPTFDSLIEMVDHYHNKADGLLCPLKVPCVRPKQGAEPNMANGGHEVTQARYPATRHVSVRETNSGQNVRLLPFLPHQFSQQQYTTPAIPASNVKGFLGQISATTVETSKIRTAPAAPPPARVKVDDETQKVYDSVPTNEASFNLSTNDLELFDKLGAGCFGSVLRGVYRQGGREIPVAVKTLKLDDEQSREEILTEAHLMAALKHRHIVRLIGVCHGDQIMLVLELAPMGPLNKFLKERVNVKMETILNLMYQVALGMRYLESQRFVHRDLAARNVLLVNENFAKISDFGMSKALGMDGEYYKASRAGKWPLKWYAPECIYYFKFDSKSDVWSYGVTLWEATSRGGKPYQKLKGAEIVKMIDEGERLEKPSECPPEVYNIMQRCWQYEKESRPSFEELIGLMKRFSLRT